MCMPALSHLPMKLIASFSFLLAPVAFFSLNSLHPSLRASRTSLAAAIFSSVSKFAMIVLLKVMAQRRRSVWRTRMARNATGKLKRGGFPKRIPACCRWESLSLVLGSWGWGSVNGSLVWKLHVAVWAGHIRTRCEWAMGCGSHLLRCPCREPQWYPPPLRIGFCRSPPYERRTSNNPVLPSARSGP
jgi:hypothetical protein